MTGKNVRPRSNASHRVLLGVVLCALSSACRGRDRVEIVEVVLSPQRVTIASGGTAELRFTSRDERGIRERVRMGESLWTASGGTLEIVGNGVARITAPWPSTITVEACRRSLCDVSTIEAVSDGAMNVHVRDAETRSPISGASVTVAGLTALSATNGSALVTGTFGGPVTVEVTADGYWPVQVTNTIVRELTIPLRSSAPPLGNGRVEAVVEFDQAFGREEPPADPATLWVAFVQQAFSPESVSSFRVDRLFSTEGVILRMGGVDVPVPENVFLFSVSDAARLDLPAGTSHVAAAGVEIRLQEVLDVMVEEGMTLETLDGTVILVRGFPRWFERAAFSDPDQRSVVTGETAQATYTLERRRPSAIDVSFAEPQDPFPERTILAAFSEVAPGEFFAGGLAETLETDARIRVGLADPSVVIATRGTDEQWSTTLRRDLVNVSHIVLPPFLAPPSRAYTMTTAGTFSSPAVWDADVVVHRIERLEASGPFWISREWDVYEAGGAEGTFSIPGVPAANASIRWTAEAISLETLTFEALLDGSPLPLDGYPRDVSRRVETVTHP